MKGYCLYSSIFLVIGTLTTNCSLFQTKKEVEPSFVFQSCMETFSDLEKCKEMESKSEKKQESESKSRYKKQIELTPEQEKNLFIRDELKNALDSKNKLYVLKKLGEPELKKKSSDGKVYFIYNRPISRYSVDHDPDLDITVVFLRDHVTKVLHTPPTTTPDTGFLLRKKIKTED